VCLLYCLVSLQGQDCFICKKGGHRAKDCPEKHKGGTPSLKICLKCGDSGHEMFSCRNDYSPDDLKVVYSSINFSPSFIPFLSFSRVFIFIIFLSINLNKDGLNLEILVP
jgi:hypothetical protein